MKRLNSAVVRVFIVLAASCSCSAVNAEMIYFGTSNTGASGGTKIQRVALDGTGLETIIANGTGNGPSYRSMAVDPFGQQMFFSAGAMTFAQNLDGTGLTTISNQGSTDIELDLLSETLYFADGSHRISQMNFDGSGLGIAADYQSVLGNIAIVSLAVDVNSGKVYFGDTLTNAFYRSDLDGGNLETLIQFAVNVDLDDIEVDGVGGKIYWSDSALNKLQRANLDGTGIEDLVVPTAGGAFGGRLALDVSAQKVYWSGGALTPEGTIVGMPGRIFSVNFDGTNIEQVLVSDGAIVGLDIGPFVPLDSGGGVNPIPEPSSLVLLGTGCIALIGYGRRRRQKQAA